MKLTSFRSGTGEARLGLVRDDAIFDITAAIPLEASFGLSPMRRLLLSDIDDLAEWGRDLDGQRIDGATVAIDAIVPDPGKVVAAPVNYFDHKEEMNEDAHIDSLGVFLKAPTSVMGSGGTVRLPYTDRRFDQEGELAVVIGKEASHISASDALAHVAGFTMLLDMTMRGGEDRSTRKSFDTFTPVGPWLVSQDEAPSTNDMRLRTWVSGSLRQDADVSDLIWDVPRLIEYVSSVMVLKPGDIVTTGTPAGIGEVHDGDDIALSISGLGELNVTVSNRGAVACPTLGANRGPKPPDSITPVRKR